MKEPERAPNVGSYIKLLMQATLFISRVFLQLFMCRIVGFAETMWKRELLSNNFHNLCSPLNIVYLLTIINTVPIRSSF